MWQIGRDFGHSSSLCLSFFLYCAEAFRASQCFHLTASVFSSTDTEKNSHQPPGTIPTTTSNINHQTKPPNTQSTTALPCGNTRAVYKISFQSLEEADGSCYHTYIYNVMSLKNPSEKKNHGGQTLLMVLCCPPVLIRRTSCYTTAVQDAVRSLL